MGITVKECGCLGALRGHWSEAQSSPSSALNVRKACCILSSVLLAFGACNALARSLAQHLLYTSTCCPAKHPYGSVPPNTVFDICAGQGTYHNGSAHARPCNWTECAAGECGRGPNCVKLPEAVVAYGVNRTTDLWLVLTRIWGLESVDRDLYDAVLVRFDCACSTRSLCTQLHEGASLCTSMAKLNKL